MALIGPAPRAGPATGSWGTRDSLFLGSRPAQRDLFARDPLVHLHREHRAGGVQQDPLGAAAENQLSDRSSAAKPDHDQFGLGLLSDRQHVIRSEEHTSELQSRRDLVCRLLLEKKNKQK